MGSSNPSNTTQTSELPAWIKPYAQTLLTRGASLSDTPMPVYQGQRSADMNGYQQGAMQMVADRAQRGSAELQSGSQQLTDTMNGGYLGHTAGTNAYQGENPYLSNMVDQSSKAIGRNYLGATQATDSTFGRNLAFGGSAWGQQKEADSRNLADALSNNANSMYFQNYNQSAQLADSQLNRDQGSWDSERNRQTGMVNSALGYGNQAYTDAQQLAGIGQQQYAFDQQKLDDWMSQWNDQAQSPYKQLDILGNTIRSATGNQSSVSSVAPSANGLAQGVGGAAALYSMFGGKS